MAVKIRLARFGKRGKAFYRVVAVDESAKRNGRNVEILGTYDPHKTENKLEIKKDRLNYWLSVGAKPTKTVNDLLS